MGTGLKVNSAMASAARNTREGDVYLHLLLKLENERKALGGQVFDVLGKLFEDMRLKDLLMEAVRYGDQPEVKARLLQKVESAFDEERIRKLIEERSLAAGILDKSKIIKIREEMERAEARKLQPHFIRTFFVEALKTLGGAVHARESKRLEVTYVPAVIRGMNTRGNRREPILKKYERICFDKGEIDLFGRVQADFVCPGRPLLDALVDILILRNPDLLKRGAVLVDESDYPGDIRVLIYLQDELKDSCLDRQGNRRVISRHVHFIELNEKGETRNAGYAPYLDYVPITAEQGQWIRPLLEASWLKEPLEPKILEYAAEHILPRHKEEVRQYKDGIGDRRIFSPPGVCDF